METPIQIPRKEDPLRWAMLPKVHALWVANYAYRYGVDSDKFLLGDVLNSITSDDAPCLYFPDLEYTREKGTFCRDQLLERLRWEMEQIQTPEEIRGRLKVFLPWTQRLDLSKKSDFINLVDAWMNEISDFTRRLIATNHVYKEALMYRERHNRVLAPPFAEFLNENTIKDQT